MNPKIFKTLPFSKALVAAALYLSCAGLSWAQTAVVRSNVNLRPDPSSSQPAIRLLVPSEELRVLSLTKVNGYYNVETDARQQGWVYAQFIEIDESTPGATVERNTNLRQGPSSGTSIIRLLAAGETVQLLAPNPTTNYYNVSTSAGEQGWAYAPNLTLGGVGPQPPVPVIQPPFPDAHESPPSGWAGPVFRLSQNYPAAQPAAGNFPWKQFDFRNPAQASQYLQAILDYAMDGNTAVDWQGQDNTVRKWYHTPWLHSGANGREFVHGLTRERSSRPRELHPNQTSTFTNYAVGLYDALGGWTIGQVWKDHENPDASAAIFAEGTVAVKLLFTTATVAQVPYLANAFEWDGNVVLSGQSTRSVQKVRLLQIDIAVRDSRANLTTGWVFGTFSYDSTASGNTPWARMRPVGLMWGNDPTLTPAQFQQGVRPTESIILNRTNQHLGWLERLNGPVDNPRSACLSCHGTAEIPGPPGGSVPGASLPDSEKLRWFRNIKAGQPFDTGHQSLDYSLQLYVGITNFFQSRGAPVR